MFVWGNLVAFVLLFVSMHAHAAEPKIYGSLEGEKQFQIKVLPAQECEQLITEAVYSQTAIEQGVSALAQIENPSAHASECLGSTLDGWQENFPVPAYSPSQPPVPVSLLHKLKAAKMDLQQERRCIQYPDSCPNPLPKSEYATLGQQIMAIDQKIERYQFVTHNLASFVFPSPEFDDSHFKKLSAQYSSCKKIPDSHGWKCGELEISDQEYTARQEEISAAQNEWFDRELAFSTRKRQVDEELDYLFAANPALWEKAQALFAAVKCVNPNHPHSLTGNSFELDPDCPKEAKQADPAQAIMQAQELFGSTAQFLANMDQRKREKEARAARKNYNHNAARNFNYGLEALLARYDHFLRHGGKPETLASFCAENERTQLRDHDFALVGEKMYAPVLSYAEDGRYLKIARDYGLSEGEIWAINRFTSKFYSQINAALLAGHLSPELTAYKTLLDAALAKLPAYQGGPVKRFVSFPQAVLQEHQAGNVVCYKSFSSTSKKPDWAWDGKQELLIYPAANGKDVSKISNSESEEEVLFASNSCFKVLSANGDATKFVLGEVDKSGKVIAKLPKKLEFEQP